jgi:hypothetical protein
MTPSTWETPKPEIQDMNRSISSMYRVGYPSLYLHLRRHLFKERGMGAGNNANYTMFAESWAIEEASCHFQ